MVKNIKRTTNFSFEVWGKWALFTDPIMRLGGEKFTYPIPTYEALKGITESIYWKPTVIIYIDKLRVMNPINVEAKSIRLYKYNKASATDLARYTYLRDVRYQVQAHLEFNLNYPDLAKDRDYKKHWAIMENCIKRGGRRDIFLGTRECQGYVKPCTFGEGEGYYDNSDDRIFGTMFHGFDYPNETGDPMMKARLWNVVMQNGVVSFPRPEDCPVHKPLRKVKTKDFKLRQDLKPIVRLYDEMFGGGTNE